MLPLGESLGHRSVASGELLKVGQGLRVSESAGGFKGLDRIHRRAGERGRHGVEEILRCAAFQLIDHAEHGSGLRFGYAQATEVAEPECAVGDPDPKILLRQAEAEEAIGTERDDLGIGRGAGFAKQVGVELIECAETALLRLLITVVLADREPADGLGHTVGLGSDHPGQRRRHLRS